MGVRSHARMLLQERALFDSLTVAVNIHRRRVRVPGPGEYVYWTLSTLHYRRGDARRSDHMPIRIRLCHALSVISRRGLGS